MLEPSHNKLVNEISIRSLNADQKDDISFYTSELKKLYENKPKNYVIENRIHDVLPIWLSENKEILIIGLSNNAIGGIASYWISDANKDIGNISKHPGFNDKIGEGPPRDQLGKAIEKGELSSFAGYNKYQGNGKVIYLDSIEIFVRNQGLGSKALEFLQSIDCELIELEAIDDSVVSFFEKSGFQLTGLTTDDGYGKLMVWNNPDYLI